MATANNSELCFITPTFSGDLDRFSLLRDSIRAFGQGQVPHYALVNTEDLAALEALHLPGVIPIVSRDLLAPEVEAKRLDYLHSGGRRWKTLQRSLNKRLGWYDRARYYGWQIQQVLKLAVPAYLPHRVYVSFDSDIVVTRPFELSDFVRGEKVVLYESVGSLAARAKPHGWYVNACRLLEQPTPEKAGDRVIDYVAQPFVFEKGATLQLHRWLESRYARPWWESLFSLPLGGWSEFMTYGLFVREHLGHAGVWVEQANANNIWLHTEAERRDAANFIAGVFDNPAAKYLVLQADHSGHWTHRDFAPIVHAQLSRKTAWRPGG